MAEINIKKSSKSVVESVLEVKFAEALSQQEKNNFRIFQGACKNFIQQVNRLYAFTLSLQKEQVKTLLEQLYGMMKEGQHIKEVLSAQHRFEVALDEFLGRETLLSIVMEDGTPIFYSSENIGAQLYEKATGNAGRGNIDATGLNNQNIGMFDFASTLTTTLQEKIRYSVANKKEVYRVALEKYRKNSYDRMHYDNSKNTLYWRLWDYYHITDWSRALNHAGVIAEGYMEAVLNDDPEITNDNIENSIYLMYNKYILLDSIPAAIKADVQIKDTNIQVAIKEGKFSTARIGQFYNLAVNSLKIEQELSVEKFKLILPKFLQVSNEASKIINNINKNAPMLLQKRLVTTTFSDKASGNILNVTQSYRDSWINVKTSLKSITVKS